MRELGALCVPVRGDVGGKQRREFSYGLMQCSTSDKDVSTVPGAEW